VHASLAYGAAVELFHSGVRHWPLRPLDRADGFVMVRPSHHGRAFRLLVPGSTHQKTALLRRVTRPRGKARRPRMGHALAGSLLLPERHRCGPRRIGRCDAHVLIARYVALPDLRDFPFYLPRLDKRGVPEPWSLEDLEDHAAKHDDPFAGRILPGERPPVALQIEMTSEPPVWSGLRPQELSAWAK